MAVIQKIISPENLEKYGVFLNDTDANSKYFKITELPDTFTGGKNAFLIQGSEYLVPDTLIKVEIKDARGNTIYYEPGEGIISSSVNGESFVTEYYEGVSKVVSVYIYPDTAYGPCTITILGEISSYESNGLISPIPTNWEGQYNVKWQKQVNVNPALANLTKIRFYKRPTAKITELLNPIYSFVGGNKVASPVTQSFANIKLSNLETFAGDVKRIKVFRTSLGDISDYDLIQDILVESKELLTTYGLSGSVVGNTGIFTSEVLKNQWNSGSLNATLNNSRVEAGVRLTGSGYFTYTQSLDLKSTNTYELSLDAFYSASTDSNLGIYLVSGSTSSSIGTLIGTSPTKNLLDTTIPFTIDKDYPTASLYLSQSQGEWHVGNISLKLSEDTAFSPDEVSFITTMPTVLGNETFNFKFEFYDVNNNYVPVAVTQSALFNGGNNNIGGTLIYISSSASSSLENLNRVSSSISGTMTVYSSSASSSVSILSGSVSGTINTLSGSVSGTINTLSSSVSQSVALTLSSSLSTIKLLADGGYPGTFIESSSIYSPNIAGINGYFSNKFQVGNTNPIVLDASTSTRKIYVGTGTYNNTNTSIYLDSTGQFSLKDKLTFDTSGNLIVNGTINVTGGTAATDANALLYSQRAAASASISASAAQSNAASDATAKANTAYNNATAQLQLLADGGYSGSFIGSTTIYSPNIGGQNGYISNIFKVGSGGAITLDGGNKKIYVGTGTHNNSNTAFYVDNDGKMSLKDKFVWDGNNLTVNGSITVTGGNAATNDNLTSSLSNKINTGGAAGDVNSNVTTISGGKIRTGTIESTGYAYTSGDFSTAGMQINLDNGVIRSKNFGITSGGDAYFKGAITGGTISIGSNFSVSSGGVITAAGAILSGSINATGGQIGGWTIQNGKLTNDSNRLIIDPSIPGISIYDDTATKRLDYRYGSLSNPTSTTVTIAPASVNVPYQFLSSPTNYNNTFTADSSTFSVSSTGTYTNSSGYGVIAYNFFNAQTNWSGYAGANLYVEIINNSTGLSEGAIYVASADIYKGTGGAVSDDLSDASTSLDYINLTAGVTYKLRTTIEIMIYSSYSSSDSFELNGQILSISSKSYNLQLNQTELTNEGLQVMASSTNYVRMQRGGYGNRSAVIYTEGNSDFNTDAASDSTNTTTQNASAAALRLSNAQGASGYALNVVLGQSRFANLAFTTGGSPNRTVYVTTEGLIVNANSDRTMKENILPYTNGLKQILQLNPVSFNWKDKKLYGDTNDLGLIAQDVESVLPELVGTSVFGQEDEKQFKLNLAYDKLVIPLINAVKELSAKVELLEAKISGSV